MSVSEMLKTIKDVISHSDIEYHHEDNDRYNAYVQLSIRLESES